MLFIWLNIRYLLDSNLHLQLPTSRRPGPRTARLKRGHAHRHSNQNGNGAGNQRHHFSRASMRRAASKVWKRLTRLSGRKVIEEQQNSVSKIDRTARILFPLTFFMFNLVYCLVYYASGSDLEMSEFRMS